MPQSEATDNEQGDTFSEFSFSKRRIIASDDEGSAPCEKVSFLQKIERNNKKRRVEKQMRKSSGISLVTKGQICHEEDNVSFEQNVDINSSPKLADEICPRSPAYRKTKRPTVMSQTDAYMFFSYRSRCQTLLQELLGDNTFNQL